MWFLLIPGAEKKSWHLKHFCCYDCDRPLAGHKYIPVDGQPRCIECYQKKHGKVNGGGGDNSLMISREDVAGQAVMLCLLLKKCTSLFRTVLYNTLG